MTAIKVLVVTNFAPHYRVPLFELLHRRLGAEFIFFSDGTESYWQRHLGVSEGDYPAAFTRGRRLFGNVRLNFALMRELLSRDYDVVIKCMNGQVELMSTYAIARLRRKRFILWTGMWMHPTTKWHRFTKPFADYLYRHSDAVITYGKHVSQFVVCSGANPDRVYVAENAVDVVACSRRVSRSEREQVRERFGIGDGRIVLSVARLTTQKGLKYLIDALSGLSAKPTLVVVGTGPDGPLIVEQARTAGVRLALVGGLEPEAMPPIYAIADVFVLPSVSTPLVKETWGLSVNEAMCQSCPVIVTDAVGAAAGGLVVDGKTGLVVPERDSQALATALELVLGDRDLARCVGSEGKNRVMQTNYDGMLQGFARAVEHVDGEIRT